MRPSKPLHMKSPFSAILRTACTEYANLPASTGHPQRTLRIINANQVAYLDSTGSGCETISHIYENGRVTVMFNSFGKAPQILRLFCSGRVVERGSKDWPQWLGRFQEPISADGDSEQQPQGEKEDRSGARAVIILDVWKVQTSCGFGVPIFAVDRDGSPAQLKDLPTSFERSDAGKLTKDIEKQDQARYWQDRETLPKWAGHMVEKGAMANYQKMNNYQSLDGCPGVRFARKSRGQVLWVDGVLQWLQRVFLGQWDAVCVGVLVALIGCAVLRHLGAPFA